MEIICHRGIGQWLVGKIPARPNIYAIIPPSMSKQPAPSFSIIGTFDTSTQAIHYRQLSKKPRIELKPYNISCYCTSHWDEEVTFTLPGPLTCF
jgi:hypothetical protein